jgi:hypothetical protein
MGGGHGGVEQTLPIGPTPVEPTTCIGTWKPSGLPGKVHVVPALFFVASLRGIWSNSTTPFRSLEVRILLEPGLNHKVHGMGVE